MTELRESKGMTLKEAARQSDVSEVLLDYLERLDSKTLPSLARQIGKAYGMTLAQANDLAKPLRARYAYPGYVWCPPKEETVPLIDIKPEKAVKKPPEPTADMARLVQATGKSARQLSLEAGRTGSYVGNILLALARGRVLEPSTRKRLAEILNCDEQDLKGGGGREATCIPVLP